MILYENEVRKMFEALGKDSTNWNFQVLCRKVNNFDKIFKTEPKLKDNELGKLAVYIFYNVRNNNSLTIKQGDRPMEQEEIKNTNLEVDENDEIDFEDLLDDGEESEEETETTEEEETPKKRKIAAKDVKPFHPLGDDDEQEKEDSAEDMEDEEDVERINRKKTKEPKQKKSKKERDSFGYGIGTIGNSINEFIKSKQEGCTTKEIIETLNINPTTVFPHICTLIKKGFVYRENHLIKIKENN